MVERLKDSCIDFETKINDLTLLTEEYKTQNEQLQQQL